MNKYLKGCLIILGILILIILIFCGIIYYQTSTSRQRNSADDIECANTNYIITDHVFELSDGISTKNVSKVKLVLIQDVKTMDSADVINNSSDHITFSLPFKKVKLSDRIIIKTQKNKYVIEKMEYFNDAKWGMFGYLGIDCQLSYSWKKINR